MAKDPSFDICAGATASAGSTTLTFNNNRNSSCTVSDDGTDMSLIALLGLSSLTVAAQDEVTVGIQSDAQTGTYTYNASCCPQGGNPQIIYQ